jgi:hypothetical protein
MTSHWGHQAGPNVDLWFELECEVGVLLCQYRALESSGSTDEHPMFYDPNGCCERCEADGISLVEDLRELLQAYGSTASRSGGSEWTPEPEAAQRALRAMIDSVYNLKENRAKTATLLYEMRGCHDPAETPSTETP